ncbi:hypothetical protein DNX69_10970 [Rhodopseudomonas palustris]|uniref:DNA modification protein n=1 Tax=Rhodopseudomonas palustris TaxID=1076 RepID=A0A323UJW0_RHOPL|nr:hypothetical protein [Rhodopseudomonas palustris]PZA12487.1 hypothetical protein DNX69_10970 [Rhodopseudomonas palustris]
MSKPKPHHPPVPGPYERPWTDVPRYIYGTQAVAGFGTRWFYVARIERALACEMVIRHHYSGRIVKNSYVHLGVFIDGQIVGVMQFGYALNPAAMGKVVEGSSSIDYLELNRMWLSDAAPRNSESRAIAYAVRYIKEVMPQVSWLQTFADERCGGWGVVYQAANFTYVGCHFTAFYELDGEFFHEMLLSAHSKMGQRGAYLRQNLDRATRQTFRQFRYVFFIRRSWRKRLRLAPKPYPKRWLEAPSTAPAAGKTVAM